MKKRSRGFLRFIIRVFSIFTFIVASNFFVAHRLSVQAASLIDDTPVNKKIFLLIFNPTIENQGNKKLTQVKGWNDPDDFTNQLIARLASLSNGYIHYTISQRQEIDGLFVKPDGYQYTDDTYLACTNGTGPCHAPDIINYSQLFSTYTICDKNVDEVWMWGGPWFGYWEYNPVNFCGKTQFVMGFNYERGIGEALHDFGHRMEFVGHNRVGKGTSWGYDTASENETSDWNKFAKMNYCGNIHFPPGNPVSGPEYIYNNHTPASSNCDGFLSYPNDPYTPQTITCTAWNCSQEGFVSWWLHHIPHNPGISIATTDGKVVYNNWWKYFAYYPETDTALVVIPGDIASSTGTPGPDGCVDIFDYNIIVTYFGQNGSSADIDNNGKVDIFDYNILVTNFGR